MSPFSRDPDRRTKPDRHCALLCHQAQRAEKAPVNQSSFQHLATFAKWKQPSGRIKWMVSSNHTSVIPLPASQTAQTEDRT